MPRQIDIEEIVREVLAKLRTSGTTQQSLLPADRLELRDRLVTMATLEHRLEGICHLTLPRGAVVTPAARDLLRERNVRVSYATCASKSAVTLVVGVAELDARRVNFDVATFIERLARDEIGIEQLAATGLANAVAELADHAGRGGRPALLLTDRPEAAACLANRERGVRAVGGRDLAELKRAIPEVAANLLAVDPAAAPAAFCRLVREFYAGWPRAVPAILDVDLRGN